MNQYLYDIISSAGNLSTEDIITRILVSVVFGIAIFASYRLTHSGSVYSNKFNITLLTLTILTTMVMTVIGNNVALSLGMVGALSIVRFRTSVKDSRDTVYIFWTIIIGICCGVGDYVVAAVGSSMVFLVLLAFGRVSNTNRLLLILRADRIKEEELRRVLFQYFPKPPVQKAQNTTAEKTELIFELNQKLLTRAENEHRLRAISEQKPVRTLIDELYAVGGVDYANLVMQSDEIN